MGGGLAEILSRTAGARPHRPALLYADGAISFAELDERASAVAAELVRRGVCPGDRVAVALPNAPSFAAGYFGVLRAGAIAVPLNVLLREREIAQRFRVVEPSLVVLDRQRETELGRVAREHRAGILVLDEHAQELPAAEDADVDRADDDAAVILFTSGTSGASKAAVLTHGGIVAAARNAADAFGFGPSDVIPRAAPFSHVLGQSSGLVAGCLTGAAVAVVPRFEAETTLAEMASTQTTVFLGVPAMCIALCEAAKSAARLPPLRLAHVGGAPVPVEVARSFERTFAAPVYEGYGLTELSGIATTYRAGAETRPGSVGKAVGSTELRVVSGDGDPLGPGAVGEVQLRGPSVVTAYWQDGGPNTAALVDGWLATGDLGRVDDEGFLYLVDRKQDLVIRGGYNVYPREIEEVLYEHPDVREAVIVGVPDPSLGEEVVALVALREGAEADAGALREWMRARVAAFKYPRHVVLVDELPKGPTGKILRRAIDRAALAASLAASGDR